MRPSARLLNLEVASLQGPRTLYVCSTCRQEARPRAAVLARQFPRHASSSNNGAASPLTERVRRKLWGTDNPPGLKDPYGGRGVLEQKFGRDGAVEQQQQQQQEEGGEEQARSQLEVQEGQQEGGEQEGAAVGAEYVPATSWEGLERVGHLGRWADLPPSVEDSYSPFGLKEKLAKRGHLNLAAHQAAVELCLLHALKKPLASICDVVEHDKSVFKMIWKCKIQPGADGLWDNALVYPNKETEAALVYIFEQIGGQPEAESVAETAGEAEDVDQLAEEADDVFPEDLAGSPGLPFFGYSDVRDRGFLSLALDDSTKFAFLKRFSQLSGHYFPDPTIHAISSVKEVVDYIHHSLTPKQTKLVDQLAKKGSVLNRPNIKVFAKKQRPSDRDEELGRKKIIGDELRARGLIV